MADLGKVVVTDGGDYSPGTPYEKLTFVHHESNTYMTLKTVTDITPTDDGINYKLFCRSAELATATAPGIIKPDGTTTEVSTDGSLSVKKAAQNALGLVKGSNGIKVGSDGSVDVNTLFTQATELANIIAGEAISTALGKISKSIAVTMGLDQNALLKNMLTNIDANDQNKIPTAALVHKLTERIGMNEELEIGTSLTNAVKLLNSNLATGGSPTSLQNAYESQADMTIIIYKMSGSTTDRPSGSSTGFVISARQASTYGTQMAFYNAKIAVRGIASKVWTNWADK